jgi:hypothetical protein
MQADFNKYLLLMMEVKHRTAVIDAILGRTVGLIYDAPTIEAAYLQFRRILELVAMGSLVANQVACATIHTGFAEWWRAKQILDNVEQLNPDFYPKPTLQLPSKKPNVKRDLVDRPDGYLTRPDFVTLYDKSSELLHTPNPFGRPIDYAGALPEISTWRDKIVGLLDAHRIKLLGDPNLYLVQMCSPNESPTYAVFAPVPGGASST